MELFSKTLKPTDVKFRLSFPTWAMRERFRLNQGQQLDFQVLDNNSGQPFTFRLSTRNSGHPKPVLTKGWIHFVKRKGLKKNDKIKFIVQGDQLRIQALRQIRLMGQDICGEISN